MNIQVWKFVWTLVPPKFRINFEILLGEEFDNEIKTKMEDTTSTDNTLLLEFFPYELLRILCEISETVLILMLNRNLNNYLTTDERLNFMIKFGHRVVFETNGIKQSIKWYKKDVLHRVGGPAEEILNMSRRWHTQGNLYREQTRSHWDSWDDPECPEFIEFWYKEGELHRLDGPAVIYADGAEKWYKEGEPHRLDGPAVKYPNGDEYWYKEGVLHRLDGPAIIFTDGREKWYKEGKLHRIGGPAVIYPNRKEKWYKEGKLHRVGGPAVIYPNGDELWYKEGVPQRRQTS